MERNAGTLFDGEGYAEMTVADVETTEVVLRLRVNTGTYADAESIIDEIGDSLGWLYYDHDAIIEAVWEVGAVTPATAPQPDDNGVE